MRGLLDTGSAIVESWFSSEERRGAMRGLRRDGEEGGDERICVKRREWEGEGEVERRIMRSWSYRSKGLEYSCEWSFSTEGVVRERTEYCTSFGRLGLRIWRSEKRRIEIFVAAVWAAIRSWAYLSLSTYWTQMGGLPLQFWLATAPPWLSF